MPMATNTNNADAASGSESVRSFAAAGSFDYNDDDVSDGAGGSGSGGGGEGTVRSSSSASAHSMALILAALRDDRSRMSNGRFRRVANGRGGGANDNSGNRHDGEEEEEEFFPEVEFALEEGLTLELPPAVGVALDRHRQLQRQEWRHEQLREEGRGGGRIDDAALLGDDVLTTTRQQHNRSSSEVSVLSASSAASVSFIVEELRRMAQNQSRHRCPRVTERGGRDAAATTTEAGRDIVDRLVVGEVEAPLPPASVAPPARDRRVSLTIDDLVLPALRGSAEQRPREQPAAAVRDHVCDDSCTSVATEFLAEVVRQLNDSAATTSEGGGDRQHHQHHQNNDGSSSGSSMDYILQELRRNAQRHSNHRCPKVANGRNAAVNTTTNNDEGSSSGSSMDYILQELRRNAQRHSRHRCARVSERREDAGAPRPGDEACEPRQQQRSYNDDDGADVVFAAAATTMTTTTRSSSISSREEWEQQPPTEASFALGASNGGAPRHAAATAAATATDSAPAASSSTAGGGGGELRFRWNSAGEFSCTLHGLDDTTTTNDETLRSQEEAPNNQSPSTADDSSFASSLSSLSVSDCPTAPSAGSTSLARTAVGREGGGDRKRYSVKGASNFERIREEHCETSHDDESCTCHDDDDNGSLVSNDDEGKLHGAEKDAEEATESHDEEEKSAEEDAAAVRLEKRKMTTVPEAPEPASERAATTAVVNAASRRSGPTTMVRKIVCFSSVEIRQYDRILGDHPCCSDGPPLGIGWTYDSASTRKVSVRHHHAAQTRRGSSRPTTLASVSSVSNLVVPRESRTELLLDMGYTPRDIAAAVRINLRIKSRRRQTVNNIGHVSRMEEVVESVRRKVKKAVLKIFSARKSNNWAPLSPGSVHLLSFSGKGKAQF